MVVVAATSSVFDETKSGEVVVLGLGLDPVEPVCSLEVGDSVAELSLLVPGVRLGVPSFVAVSPLGEGGPVAEVLDTVVLRAMVLLEVPDSSTAAVPDPVMKVDSSVLVVPDPSEDERSPVTVDTVDIELVPLCTVVVTTSVAVPLVEVNIVPSVLVIMTNEAEVAEPLSLLVELVAPEMVVVVTSVIVL